MAFARLEPHDVAGPDLLDRPALALHAAAPGGHHQCLSERMRMPGRARARLKGHGIAGATGRIANRKKRIDAHGAGKPVGRPRRRRLGSCSLDVHGKSLLT